MEAKSAVKVGLLTLVGLALSLTLYFYLSHINPNVYLVKIRFKDTKGLATQGVVRMRGVKVGEVKSVALENYEPVVTIAVQKTQDIPQGSLFRVVSGILITNPQLEIEPVPGSASLPKDNTAVVSGAETASALSALDPNLGEMVVKLNRSFDKLDKRLDEATGGINTLLKKSNRLVDNLDTTVTSSRKFLLDPRLKESLLTTVDNFKEISASARVTANTLSTELTKTVKKSGGSVDKLTSRLFDILTRIDTTLETANTVVNKLTEQVTDPRLQQSLQETTELAGATLARFNQIASDLHQITGDPQLQSDLKQTVANLREATDNGKQAVEKVNTLIGGVTGTIGKAKNGFRLPKTELVANISEQTSPARLRVDAEARVHLNEKSLVNLGLYDIGQETRFTLQAGTYPTKSVLFRYGLYASRIGVGLEWEPTPGTGIRADLYDTDRTRLDFRALFRVKNQASLWLGAERIFRDPTPVIGFQIKQ